MTYTTIQYNNTIILYGNQEMKSDTLGFRLRGPLNKVMY